jgi:hypothetical protein
MRTYIGRDVITADQQVPHQAPARRFDGRERADFSGTAPRLGAKLAVPQPPYGQVARPRLAGLLDAATRGRLTLLTAPAGWGKTALLSAWLRARNPAGPVCWLTADESDTGARFWLSLYAGLKSSGVTGLAWGATAQNGGPVGPNGVFNGTTALNARLAARTAGVAPHNGSARSAYGDGLRRAAPNSGPAAQNGTAHRHGRAVAGGPAGHVALPLPGLRPDGRRAGPTARAGRGRPG